MAARKDDRIQSATFFASMVDFAEAGELSVFIDEEQLASLDLGNYAEPTARAPAVATYRAACESARVTVDEAACLARADCERHEPWTGTTPATPYV